MKVSENPRESGSPGLGRDVEPDEPSDTAPVPLSVTQRFPCGCEEYEDGSWYDCNLGYVGIPDR